MSQNNSNYSFDIKLDKINKMVAESQEVSRRLDYLLKREM